MMLSFGPPEISEVGMLWRILCLAATAGGVSFEDVKVDLTLVSNLEVPLPRFPLFHEDGEDNARLLVRVEQEARNIVGSYTHTEHEAHVSSLPNGGCLNRVLKLTGVAYGPRPVPASAEVLKKRS
jgi:hypothetical protein